MGYDRTLKQNQFYEFFLQDSKYLGELMKCNDPDSVRCCGVSSHSTVGLPIRLTSTVAPLTTKEILLLNRFSEIESTEPSNTLTTEVIMENPTTFLPDASTTDVPLTTTEQYGTTLADDNLIVTTITPEAISSTLPSSLPIKVRRPKMIDNVFMIYPSEMSGIPQTSPRNMPDNNEMNMFDEETGLKVHLIFATNSTEPSLPITPVNAETTTLEDSTTISAATTFSTTPTTTRSRNNGQYKKRRRYRPGRAREANNVDTTTNSPNTANKITASGVSSRSAASRIRLPVLDNKKKQNDPLKTVVNTTTSPDRTRTKNNRSRLFNSSNRLNFLRKNQVTTPGTSDDEDSSSESAQIITTAQPDIEQPIPVMMPTPNRRFMSRIDKQHEYMIEAVRLVLMSASSEDSESVVDAPKSFRNRMTNIEQMLINTLNNTFVEMAKDQKMNRPYRGKKRYTSYLASLTTPVPPASSTPPAIERNTRPVGLRRYRIWPLGSTTPPTLRTENILSEPKETLKKTPRRRLRLNFRNSETTSTTTEQPMTTIFTDEVTDEIVTTEEPEIASTIFESQQDVATDIPASSSIKFTPQPLREPTIPITYQFQPTTDLSLQKINAPINFVSIPTTPPAPTVLSPGSLIAEFKPSPSWALNNEQIRTIRPNFVAENAEISTARQSRGLFREPKHLLGGFVPMVVTNSARNYNYEPELLIVGPIPRPHPVRDDGLIRFQLPAITGNVRSLR